MKSQKELRTTHGQYLAAVQSILILRLHTARSHSTVRMDQEVPQMVLTLTIAIGKPAYWTPSVLKLGFDLV